MDVTETGVPVASLVDAVKAAIKEARVSTSDSRRTLKVSEVRLTLNAVAATTGGAKFEFTIPFIGMKLGLGGSVTTTDTHTIDITLVPSDLKPGFEVRGADVDDVLVDAIETVMAVMAHASGGDDPFVLKESTVELTFAVTAAGTISLGVSGENKNEVTHTLKLMLAVPDGPAQVPVE